MLRRARAQQLDGWRLPQRFLGIAYIESDHAAVGREIHWYAGKPEEYISFGFQPASADVPGQRREAIKLYGRAAKTALSRGLRDAAAQFDEADARAEALLGNCPPVLRVGRPPLALALCGSAAAAEKLAAQTSVDGFASATPYERAFPEVHSLRGLAYLRMRKGTKAAAEFQNILNHKGANWGLFYAFSYPGLARPAALAGDIVKSKQAYREFFALWKKCRYRFGYSFSWPGPQRI